jgi:hypothetical protein
MSMPVSLLKCAPAALLLVSAGFAQAADQTAPLPSLYQPGFTPMSQRERFRSYVKDTVSPVRGVTAAFSAGLNQWRDAPEEWEQGGSGYGKRVANAYARTVVRQSMIYGLSAVLHEDNRYFRRGDGSVGSRIKYALESTVLARADDGTRGVSISRIGGTAGGAFVSTLWLPPSMNSAGDAWRGFGISMGTQAAINVAREFLPRRFGRFGGGGKQ